MEILQEGLTRNLGAFSRFLEAASFSQAAVLNVSEVARQCAVDRKTVEEYFHILEDLLLAVRIPVFTRRASRETTTHPKFFFFDTGVFRSIRPRGPLDSPQEIDGPALETLFLQELRALNSYGQMGYDVYYWQTRKRQEVDFVVYGEHGFHAFEIKRASAIRGSDVMGLRVFLEDYPEARGYCLHGGKRSYREGGITMVPYEKGLRELPELLKPA